jgi:hypothetical protein
VSTWSDLGDASASRRGRNSRRVGFVVLLLIVLLGLFGLLGPREQSVRAEGGGYTLDLTYGSIVRSGQPVPLEITVDPSMGFDGPVEVVLDAEVFDSFDFQNWYPNPDKETRSEAELTYEFEPPDSGPLTVHLDARVSPGLSFGPETHWVAVVVDGTQVVRGEYKLWVAP